MTFGDDKRGTITVVGKIGKFLTHSIDNVYLVNGLKHNLLSVSQLCDKGHKVEFTSKHCRVINTKTNDVILEGYRHNNVFKSNLSNIPYCSINCLTVLDDDHLWLWYRRFGYVSQTLLQKLNSQNLVISLPKTKFVVDKV